MRSQFLAVVLAFSPLAAPLALHGATFGGKHVTDPLDPAADGTWNVNDSITINNALGVVVEGGSATIGKNPSGIGAGFTRGGSGEIFVYHGGGALVMSCNGSGCSFPLGFTAGAFDNEIEFSRVWDPLTLATGGCATIDDAGVTGAALGDSCEAAAGIATASGSLTDCKVVAANTVRFQFCNFTGVNQDLASSTWVARISR